MFFKIGVPEKFCYINRKTPMSKSLYYLKENPARVFSWEYCKFSKNSFFYRTPLMVASEPQSNIRNVKRYGLSNILLTPTKI